MEAVIGYRLERELSALLVQIYRCLIGSTNYERKLEEHSIEVHNSRRPLDRLTLTVILTLTFDLILIGRQGIVMDYTCAKFGDFSLSRFGFIVRTDRQTESQRRMINTYYSALACSNNDSTVAYTVLYSTANKVCSTRAPLLRFCVVRTMSHCSQK